MKSIIALIALAAVTAAGQTTVRFSTKDYAGQALNRKITISAAPDTAWQSDGTNIFMDLPKVLQPAGGVVTTNLWPNHYYVTIEGISKAWSIWVPRSDDVINAAAISQGLVTIAPVGTLPLAAGTNVTMVTTNGTNVVSVDLGPQIALAPQRVDFIKGSNGVPAFQVLSTGVQWYDTATEDVVGQVSRDGSGQFGKGGFVYDPVRDITAFIWDAAGNAYAHSLTASSFAGDGLGLTNLTAGPLAGRTVTIPSTAWTAADSELIGNNAFSSFQGAGFVHTVTNSGTVSNLTLCAGGNGSNVTAILQLWALDPTSVAPNNQLTNQAGVTIIANSTPGLYSNRFTLPAWQGNTAASKVNLAVNFSVTNGMVVAGLLRDPNNTASTIKVAYWTFVSANTNLPRQLMPYYYSANGGVVQLGSSLYSYGSAGVVMNGFVTSAVTNLESALPFLQYNSSPAASAVTFNTNVSKLSAADAQTAIDYVATNQAAGMYLRPQVVFSLGPTNYAVEGKEENLYFDNIIRCSEVPLANLWVDVTATKGTQYQSFYRVVPALADVGNSALTIGVSLGTNTLATYSGTLHIAPDSAGSNITRKVLDIGDSTTAGGQAVGEMVDLGATNCFHVTGIGTQGSGTKKHEGRSGWTLADFYSGAAQASPFTNGSGQFSFGMYLANNGLSMSSGDWVFFNLGINDVFWCTTDASVASVAATFLNSFSNMAANITATVPGVRVGLCITIPPSQSQDAFGNNYGTGQHYYRYKRNAQLFAEALIASGWPYLVPIRSALDTVNNMSTATGVLNAYNAGAWTYLSNGVHPATSGYLQIGRRYFAFLKGNEQ